MTSCIHLYSSSLFFNSHSGGVELSPLGTSATEWPIVLAPADFDDGEFGGLKIGRINRSIRRKPAPAPLCPPQISLARPGLEPRPRGGKPATNRLSYGAASSSLLLACGFLPLITHSSSLLLACGFRPLITHSSSLLLQLRNSAHLCRSSMGTHHMSHDCYPLLCDSPRMRKLCGHKENTASLLLCDVIEHAQAARPQRKSCSSIVGCVCVCCECCLAMDLRVTIFTLEYKNCIPSKPK
jgi:hypothetical protein